MFPAPQIKAIIFDFDGTLVNSVDVYLQMFLDLGERFGKGLTKEDFMTMNGMSVRPAIKLLVKEKKLRRMVIPYLLWNKKKLMQQIEVGTKPYPEVKTTLEALKQHYRLVIATSNHRDFLLSICKRYDLMSYFEFFLAEEDVENVKPHPEAFLKAASQLKLSPDECLVIEDSPQGVKAAVAAKMRCCAVEHTTEKAFFKQPPTQFIPNLSFLTKEFIEQL